MRTDDLMDALARDAVPVLPPLGRQLVLAMAMMVPLSLGLMLLTIGMRDDAVMAMGEGWFGIKLVLMVLVTTCGWLLLAAASRPGRLAPLWLLAVVVTAFCAAGLADIGFIGAADWQERLVGDNAARCVVTIPLLALLPLAGVLHVLRDSAPASPALAGAAAGLLAGGIGAVLYGLHCTDDSPLFLAVWYVGGIVLVVAAGALAGRKWLVW